MHIVCSSLHSFAETFDIYIVTRIPMEFQLKYKSNVIQALVFVVPWWLGMLLYMHHTCQNRVIHWGNKYEYFIYLYKTLVRLSLELPNKINALIEEKNMQDFRLWQICIGNINRLMESTH